MRRERTLQLFNRFGIDICAAQRVVALAANFGSRVSLYAHGRWADGKDIIEVITLGASNGSQVLVRAEGRDAEEAVDAIAALAAGRFGEEA